MFFSRTKVVSFDKKLIEKLKKDLVSTLSRKGIKIRDINIDLQMNNINIMVSINGNRN